MGTLRAGGSFDLAIALLKCWAQLLSIAHHFSHLLAVPSGPTGAVN